MIISKNSTKSTDLFSTFIMSVEYGDYNSIRAKIIKQCGITAGTFRNWMLGRGKISNGNQIIINHIAGKEVFPGIRLD